MIKLKIIKRAFRKLKLSGASSDPSIPQYPDALTDLESFMAELDDRPSINTGYNSTGDNATLEEESGLTLGDLDAISCGLATRIGDDYGIEVPQNTRTQYSIGVSNMMKRGATIPQVKYHSRIPRGLGNIVNDCYRYNNTFFRNKKTSSEAHQFKKDSFITWPVDFTSWLLGESLTNVSWKAEEDKIKIENEVFTDQIATAKLTFINVGVYKIQVTGTTLNKQIVIDIHFAISETLEG